MRRFLISSGAVLLAVALLLTGSPAQAAELSFADDEGDASGFAVVPSNPVVPSEPRLDLLKVNYTTTGDALLVTAQLKEFGIADASNGSTFRWYFTYNGIAYNIAQQMPGNGGENILASGPVFWKGSTNLGCGRCSVKNDGKNNTVGVLVPFKSLSSGMKSADPDQPPVGPGSKFEGLRAISQRAVGLVTATSDSADPPEGTTFTL